jgi:hypothetical protein
MPGVLVLHGRKCPCIAEANQAHSEYIAKYGEEQLCFLYLDTKGSHGKLQEGASVTYRFSPQDEV